ncbi:MAG: cytochrome-c oxidase, cbb3-type subunit I [Candidatus Sericytochromatia bacterium]|nr:cytochrome-c oxidase, cbb3-type subunit I [Candidatus Sericytochromatia bacterium]
MIAEHNVTHAGSDPGELEEFTYDDQIVRYFAYATIGWGLIAFLVGLLIALQLGLWQLNFGLPWLTFGRLRPLHTNAAIFAFAGNAIFMGVYHSSQRLLKTRMFSDVLSRMHFWGWQLIIVSAAIMLPLGITQSKEYAELEWPIDIAITVVWVIFAVNFFGTIWKRRERHIYVAIWFYIATIVTVAVLHIVNSIELPYSFLRSYPVYAGVQDGLVQWWYGHNAVAFFLTTPFLGLMYYYIPKAANRPVYSYRLSIVHFWALIFIYIWAGPHHLLNTAMPEWAQTLGMIFSLMLWAPSWGGMINGLLTLRGAWQRLRTEPIIKFLVGAVTFYGMSTFEGPLLSIKAVNSLSHYTDWTIGHVHGGTLGWNGLLTFGILYYLVPKLWNTELYSKKLANVHFWLGITGTGVYMISLWVAGITQGLMWRGLTAEGKLMYPDFMETVTRIIPLYWVRALGGTMFIIGFCIMVYNLYKTMQSGRISEPQKHKARRLVSVTTLNASELGSKHRLLEGLPMVFTVLSVIAILVGSVIEIIPALVVQEFVPNDKKIKPYTALELAGRDIYVREGCYTCHSQQIRPMVSETLRYGKPSTIAESQYDRPFQWGSKRTGPDLARVGGKYPDMWHYRHMINPREIVPQSIMPNYPWLATANTDLDVISRKLQVMQTLGVPYSNDEVKQAKADALRQAEKIAAGLRAEGGVNDAELEQRELVALIAYLQRLGKNGGVE